VRGNAKVKEIVMPRFTTLVLGALMIASPAAAHHLDNLGTPFASRGACESQNAIFDTEDSEMLLDRFPQFFATYGEVRSFLTRAFTCEPNEADGQWYITDHRLEVLNSDWFQRRLP
jgi:hypothetical protein